MVREITEETRVRTAAGLIEVLDPIGVVRPRPVQAAERVNDLNGKVICLLDNRKPGFNVFLEEIAGLLAEKYHPKEILAWRKITASAGAGPILDEITAKGCQAVITGSGD